MRRDLGVSFMNPGRMELVQHNVVETDSQSWDSADTVLASAPYDVPPGVIVTLRYDGDRYSVIVREDEEDSPEQTILEWAET